MAVRLLFTIADNEGHLPLMWYLVLSPFPPSNGDHVDPFGPKTHCFRFEQDPRPSAASSLLDQLAGRPTHHGTPKTIFVPGWRSLHACPQTDPHVAQVPSGARRPGSVVDVSSHPLLHCFNVGPSFSLLTARRAPTGE